LYLRICTSLWGPVITTNGSGGILSGNIFCKGVVKTSGTRWLKVSWYFFLSVAQYLQYYLYIRNRCQGEKSWYSAGPSIRRKKPLLPGTLLSRNFLQFFLPGIEFGTVLAIYTYERLNMCVWRIGQSGTLHNCIL
jgi:hypothetical protein